MIIIIIIIIVIIIGIGRPEEKRPLGKPRRRWKDNIKKIFKNGVGWRGLDSSGPGQGQLVGACAYGNEPSGSIKCGEFLD